MKGLNNRKTIVILILILLVGIVGLTVAYFSNTTSIDNLFSTKDYGTTIEEVFISPDNWLPGTTTDKEITVTNSGSVDEAVRISYTERWVAKDGTVLSGLIDEDGNLTDNNENSEHAAIINFSNNGDWNYFNGYYYYNYKLSPNDTTSSLIDSVTFNSKVKNSSNCTTTENNGVKTITCNSTNSGYDGATYTLTFTIETVQFDKYMSAWGTDVAIAEEQSLFCDAFEVGEVVTYNNADYYVLKNSSTSDDYVTLLKKDPLTASEVNQYSNDYVSQDGEYPYYESDTCNENTQTGCSTNYDTSDVKKIVDGWSSSFSDDLKEVNGYKTRLIIKDDLSFYLTFGTDSNGNVLYYLNAPYYLRISDNKNIWTAIGYNDSNNEVSQINFYPGIKNIKIYNKLYIRPVINIKKSVIECNCTVSDVPYKEYSVGEEIIYDSNKYYVLENSNSSKKYVTLLKDELMSANEVNNYKIENSEHYDSQNGEYPYCINRSSCSAEYNDSGIKDLLDNWSFKYNNDLVAVDGYKIRNPFWREIYNLRINDNIPEWAFIDNKIYWSDTHAYSDNLQTISSSSNLYSIDDMTNKNYIRPVIN